VIFVVAMKHNTADGLFTKSSHFYGCGALVPWEKSLDNDNYHVIIVDDIFEKAEVFLSCNIDSFYYPAYF
jgi:hypothetical protein